MGRDSFSSVSSQLMNKLRLLFLSIKLYKLRITKGTDNAGTSTAYTKRRSRSFSVGRRGLCGCIDVDNDDDDDDESSSMITRRLHRTTSSVSYNASDRRERDYDDCDYDCDVDQRAEIFINNFRSRLLMEREVSLKLRYCEKQYSF